ncbi:hypothetical protein LDENG_00292810 [Lucifuga dentata]|nr:hypothetical protein LDENG_00292810 [Lucifuga dentata]
MKIEYIRLKHAKWPEKIDIKIKIFPFIILLIKVDIIIFALCTWRNILLTVLILSC